MKKLMKKILSLLLACACVFSPTACAGGNETSSVSDNTQPPVVSCAHSYTSVTTQEATCKETGIKTYTCTLCGDSYSEDIEKTEHDYIKEEVRPTSCVMEGINAYTCKLCGDTYTEEVPKLLKHEYDCEITKEATCGSYGLNTYTCINCGDSYTQRSDKTTEHNYTSEITQPSTCSWRGIRTYTCTICGDSYEEEIPQSTEHDLTKNDVCVNCGLGSPITFELTEEEIAAFFNSRMRSLDMTTDNKGNYIFSIDFSANDGSPLAVHAVLDIVIKNINNETVYSLVKEMKPNDFQLVNGAYRYTEKIHYSKLSNITTKLDKIYYRVYVGGGAYNELELTMPALIILPMLPVFIYEYNNNGLLTSVLITDISYTINIGSYSYLFFTGEKSYDREGELYSRGCSIGYKLYDSEGYLIGSDAYITNALKEDEKFKNAKEYAFYQLLEEGKIYRLELINIG